jgi:hypothetical protein
MKVATTVLQMLVRVCGAIMIVLGLLFWSGNVLTLIPLHMLIGLVLVLSLWTLAILGAVVRVNPARVALAIVWGFIVPVLGVTQDRLLPGSAHWLIQILHLLVGLAAIGQAEYLARMIKGRLSARSARARTLREANV